MTFFMIINSNIFLEFINNKPNSYKWQETVKKLKACSTDGGL